jgi:hypothetical protein
MQYQQRAGKTSRRRYIVAIERVLPIWIPDRNDEPTA